MLGGIYVGHRINGTAPPQACCLQCGRRSAIAPRCCPHCGYTEVEYRYIDGKTKRTYSALFSKTPTLQELWIGIGKPVSWEDFVESTRHPGTLFKEKDPKF